MGVAFGILALFATTMGWYCLKQQRIIEDLEDRLDLAEAEADELAELARSEKGRADHLKLILEESEFNRFRRMA